MSTVSYKNQPGIGATGGHIYAGTSHTYTVKKVLWPEEVEALVDSLLIPNSLHVCCGKSQIGTIRLDRYEDNVSVKADADHLPFRDKSFASVLCDPPYNGKFQWNHDMLS